jgi:hypothetical protein
MSRSTLWTRHAAWPLRSLGPLWRLRSPQFIPQRRIAAQLFDRLRHRRRFQRGPSSLLCNHASAYDPSGGT